MTRSHFWVSVAIVAGLAISYGVMMIGLWKGVVYSPHDGMRLFLGGLLANMTIGAWDQWRRSHLLRDDRR